MVIEPYSRLLMSRETVNQGAALLLMSVQTAGAVGVPSDRWVSCTVTPTCRLLMCSIATTWTPTRAAGPGEDAGADLGIPVDTVPGLHHDREHVGGQRITRRRTVHRHDQGVATLVDKCARLTGVLRHDFPSAPRCH